MAPRINVPPVTRALIGALFFQSLVCAVLRYWQWSSHGVVLRPYLVLIPQLSLFFPWTFVTTTLVEGNVFTLAIATLILFHGGRYLERAWSGAEFAKFLLVVSLIPNVLTFFTEFILYALTRQEFWRTIPISGTIPLQISFLVAFSQLVPAHTVTVFRGLVSMRVPRFPLIYVGLVTFLAMTPLLSAAGFFLALYGFFTSWTYLRFYKTVFPDLDTSQSTPLRGDASETFAFAEFFPAAVKPAVAAVSEQVWLVLVSMRVCAPHQSGGSCHVHGSHATHHRGAPGSVRAEAERRRALALKALDQRLHAAASHGSPGNSSRAAPPHQCQQPVSQSPGPLSSAQQLQPVSQTATTSQPGPMLGETSYDADNDGKGDS